MREATHANGDALGAGPWPGAALRARAADDAPQADAPVTYRVISRIARSPHDARYLVQRLDAESLVLAELRVLSSDLGASAGLVRTFTEQAERVAAAARSCPGIASVHECARVVRGALLLTVERPPGATLREVLEADGRLEIPRAVRIAIQIAEALEQAHALGLVHGGLHPDNVVLSDADDTVSLTHFGFDRLLGAPARSGPSLAVDERAYQAPEQASGKTTARSDVYALGALLFEMLAGTPPAHTRSTRPGAGNLRAVRPDVTPSLERLVLQTLRVSPRFRPATVSAVCTSLWAQLSPYGRPSLPESERSWLRAVLQRPIVLAGSIVMAAALTAGAGALVVWLGHDVETSAGRSAIEAPGDKRVPPMPVSPRRDGREPRADAPREAVEPRSAAAPRGGGAPTAAPGAGPVTGPPPRGVESPEVPAAPRAEPRPAVAPSAPAEPRRPVEPRRTSELAVGTRVEERAPASRGAAQTRAPAPDPPATATIRERAPRGADQATGPTRDTDRAPREGEDPGAIIDWLLGEGARQRR